MCGWVWARPCCSAATAASSSLIVPARFFWALTAAEQHGAVDSCFHAPGERAAGQSAAARACVRVWAEAGVGIGGTSFHVYEPLKLHGVRGSLLRRHEDLRSRTASQTLWSLLHERRRRGRETCFPKAGGGRHLCGRQQLAGLEQLQQVIDRDHFHAVRLSGFAGRHQAVHITHRRLRRC